MEDLTNKPYGPKLSSKQIEENNYCVKNRKQYHSASIASIGKASSLTSVLKKERYQSQELEIFTNIDKKEIFARVLKFLEYIIPKPKELKKLIKTIDFDK